MSIKGLVGKRMSKKVKFMGEDISITKLKVAEVMEIQEASKKLAEVESEDDENMGLDILRTVIRAAVEGGDELTDEDFVEFPMDELSKLSNEIMKFSGIGEGAGK